MCQFFYQTPAVYWIFISVWTTDIPNRFMLVNECSMAHIFIRVDGWAHAIIHIATFGSWNNTMTWSLTMYSCVASCFFAGAKKKKDDKLADIDPIGIDKSYAGACAILFICQKFVRTSGCWVFLIEDGNGGKSEGERYNSGQSSLIGQKMCGLR